jgi:hypothetical protein
MVLSQGGSHTTGVVGSAVKARLQSIAEKPLKKVKKHKQLF